jgi:voltage-gated potassium channel
MFLLTEKSLTEYFEIFNLINLISVIIFIIEYVFRLYAIEYDRTTTRIRYAFTPFMIIDLLAILPTLLLFMGINTSFLRALRVVRIFKLFKLAKYSAVDAMIVKIISEKKEEFIFIFAAILILLFTITPLAYFAEHTAQPEVFSSMSTTLWWSVTTFTTVGYGDMYPVTTFGKFITTIISILGIAFYAIPGAIFTASLLDELNEKKKKKNKNI